MQENFLIGNLLKEWKEKAEGKRTIVFAINVEHSKQIIQCYTEAGIPAEHLDGTTPADERRAILRRFESGKTMVLSNVGIATEGFDLPAIECCQLVRPTKSLALYLQMVGRALRPAEGKDRAIVLDHSDSVFEHGFPEQDREWTLHGIVKKEKKKIVYLDKETQTTYEPRELPNHIKDVDLIEVNYDEVRIADLDRLVKEGKQRGRKQHWAYYKFIEKYQKPTEFEIDYFAKKIESQNGWAYYEKRKYELLPWQQNKPFAVGVMN
jgi:superfamily II DNA or RNA helicase